MLARNLTKITIIAILLGHAIGNIPFISNISFLINFTPSSEGISSEINTSTAVSLSLSIIFCLAGTFIYSIKNREDIAIIRIFEWYGCFIFGGAIFVSFYWLTLNLWSSSFPEVAHGRAAQAIYKLSSQSELWLGLASFLLLFMGNFGLYLLAKIPWLFINDSAQDSGANQ